MDRLTYRTEKGWAGVKNLEDKTVSPTSVAIHKLTDIEDFMEEHGIESLEDLKNTIANIEKLILISSKITNLEKENETLKRIVEGIDKLKQYDVDITDYVLINPKTYYIDGISLDEFIKFKQENQAFKEKWQKLKGMIISTTTIKPRKNPKPLTTNYRDIVLMNVLSKMQELEGMEE